MSRMLPFVDRLLCNARLFSQLGRTTDAICGFRSLSRFRDLPARLVSEINQHLGELELQRGQLARARKAFRRALAVDSENAVLHRLLAEAIAADPDKDARQALVSYRRSLQIDADQSATWLAYGQLAWKLRQYRRARAAFKQCLRLTPDDPDALAGWMDILIEQRKLKQARQLILAARFRNPRDGRIQLLWTQLRMQEECLARQAPGTSNNRAVVLPFVAIHRESAPASVDEFRIVRIDRGSVRRTHVAVRPRRSDSRRAP